MQKTLTWHALQEALRNCTDEKEVEALMTAETEGPCRRRWLLRMNSRRSVLRNERELAEIAKLSPSTDDNNPPWSE